MIKKNYFEIFKFKNFRIAYIKICRYEMNKN